MMTKYLTPILLALIGGASIDCAPAKQADSPKQVDCSSLNLQDKVGFSTKVGPEKKVCYSIQSFQYSIPSIPSAAIRSYEYVGLCELTEGTVEFYRNFAGPKKGGMEMNYIADFGGVLAHITFSRTSSGEITLPVIMEITPPAIMKMKKEEVEQRFQKGARLLDSIRNRSEVCRELQEYKKR